MIAFFKPGKRTIIFNWLVHLFSQMGRLWGVERVPAGVAEGGGVEYFINCLFFTNNICRG